MTQNGSNNAKFIDQIKLLAAAKYIATQSINRSRYGISRDNISHKELDGFKKIEATNDIDSMIGAEKTYLEVELEKFADSATMKSSLRQGIVNLEIIESLLERVRNPDEYKTINAAYVLPKSRRNGLPDDDARKSFRAHATRLTNLDKSRMDKTERSILEQRRKNIRVAEKIYITMQEAALGIKAGKTKDKGLDLE